QGHAKARPFLWEGGGSLVFEWQEPLALDKLRIFIGEIGNNYLVRTYLGGRLDETGVIRDPEGVQTALVTDDRRKIGQWVEVHFRWYDGRQHRSARAGDDRLLRNRNPCT
ncbi:MAG TPA: hypothetical protein DIC52_06980, partial [Candidatus Latescibacteria bacterium]|nr:hypothetical protein [Candidatus Latescibacterota bacterium]